MFADKQNLNLCFSWVKLIPGFNPSNHCFCKLVKVSIYLGKLFLDLLSKFNVTFLNSGAVFGENNILEEWDDLFLPEYAFVFLPQIYERVTGLAVVDIRQTGLDSQSQMITDHLNNHH